MFKLIIYGKKGVNWIFRVLEDGDRHWVELFWVSYLVNELLKDISHVKLA